jgi:CDP-diglyceride synthetase
VSQKSTLALLAGVVSLYANDSLADPGVSSLKGFWIFFLVIGSIIALLAILGVFWVMMTWLYLRKSRERFYRLKTYLILSISIALVSGISAFTFHANAPYSQNVYFLATTIVVITVSVLALVVQYKSGFEPKGT